MPHDDQGPQVAERERLTNKERRAQAREERKRKEAEAAAKAKRAQLRNAAITAVAVLVVGVIVFQAVRPDQRTLDEAILISSEEAEQAQEAAGCEVLAEREPLPESFHFEANAAPPPEAIYTDTRPTHSGPHTVQVTPANLDGFSRQIDERSSTHNLEHGAVIVWHDPDQADGSQIADWASMLNANGFGETAQNTGTAVLSSPYTDPGIETGKAVAFRAWGTAMDCDEFDETAANAFVARNFGERGIAPERMCCPYPEEVLDFSDLDVTETTEDEAPTEPVEGEVDPGVEGDLDEEADAELEDEGTDEVPGGDDGAAEDDG